jgi:hypothetical protein
MDSTPGYQDLEKSIFTENTKKSHGEHGERESRTAKIMMDSGFRLRRPRNDARPIF